MNYSLHSSTLVISLDMAVLYYVIIMNHPLIFHYYRCNSNGVRRKTRIYRLISDHRFLDNISTVITTALVLVWAINNNAFLRRRPSLIN